MHYFLCTKKLPSTIFVSSGIKIKNEPKKKYVCYGYEFIVNTIIISITFFLEKRFIFMRQSA